MQRLKLLSIIMASGMMTSWAQAQTVTQEEFLKRLREVHPVFVKEELSAQIEKEEQRGFLGAEDWNIASSVNFVHQEPAIAFAGPERIDAFGIKGGAQRTFWRTGGRFSASFTSTRASIELDPFYGFPDSYYENELSVSYVHPLMQNRNGFLDRLQHELKEYDIDFSEVQALENQEAFLANSAAKFVDWVFLSEQKKIVSDRLKLAEDEYARTRRKRQANLVDEVDVIRAKDAVRIVKQNQVLVASQWKALQAELAVLSQNDELYDLSPQFDLYRLEELTPLEEATSRLKSDSRLIKTLRIRLKQLEHARRGYEDTYRPDLSFVAQVGTKKLDESFWSSLGMDKPDALLGLQFRVPLERRRARSQVARTDLQIARLEKQLEEITLELSSGLANLHIQIEEMEQVLQLNQEQIESAEEKTAEELRLYNQGRGSLTFVIQSRDSEENAKLTYAQNALTYHQLILQYRALMDQLL
jgi:outer membrane protein TolC